MISRFEFMHQQHEDNLPLIVAQNTRKITLENGSSIMSLPATKRAGRSFTAALVILDEFAFMQWPDETLAAVKPTVDNGGQLFIISSSDAHGSVYHQMWGMSQKGVTNYKTVFLPWDSHPDRGEGWREGKISESFNPIDTKREYPESPEEAFALSSDTIYAGVWHGVESVTEEADFVPGAGPVYWAADDGYSAGSRFEDGIDPQNGLFAADSHPRVILLFQMRSNGQLCLFDEIYRVKTLEEDQIQAAADLGYPDPVFVAVDSSAAQLRGRLTTLGYYTRKATHQVDEGIKEMRRWLGKDKNGFRRFVVHPRCVNFRGETGLYRIDEKTQKPVKAFDHGPDAGRYLSWVLRYEA
jgi:hypothetical protein